MNRIGIALGAALIALAPAAAQAGVQYTYDSAGRMISATYSNGVTLHYRYDAAGNRIQIQAPRIPNRQPTANGDSGTVTSSATVNIQVRNNDTDPDSDPLTVTSVGAPSGGGSVAIQGGGAYVSYTAPANGGAKSFTYTISDGRGGSASATVSVNVTHVNAPPVAVNDTASTVASSTIAVMVRDNDSDPNNDTLTVTAVGAPSGGSASIATGGGYVLYTAPGTPGQYSFGYTVSDGLGGNASATVSVSVAAPPNSPPDALNDYYYFTDQTFQGITYVANVRANDTDPNGHALTITSVTDPAGSATTAIENGSVTVYNLQIGITTFDYTISDGNGGSDSATVTIEREYVDPGGGGEY